MGTSTYTNLFKGQPSAYNFLAFTKIFNLLRNYIKAFSSCICILILGFASSGETQTPVITARFANPSYTCSGQYCVDVELHSNLQGQQLFGMNVRFFYPDDILELAGFSDFQAGYGAVEPDPPIIITSGPAGPALFNFASAAAVHLRCHARQSSGSDQS